MKKILKGLMGSVVSPIDMNKMMEEIEMENKNGITNDEDYKFLEMSKE